MTTQLSSEIGSKFYARRPEPKEVSAVKKFLTTHSVDVALSLESEGIFVRMPPDDGQRFGDAVGGGGGVHDESVHLLAQTFFKVGNRLQGVPSAGTLGLGYTYWMGRQVVERVRLNVFFGFPC